MNNYLIRDDDIMTTQHAAPAALTILLAALVSTGPARSMGADDAASARRLFAASGVRGGLVVHVGCGDGRFTAALGSGDAYVVHGLDANRSNVARARERLRSLRLYGKVCVDQFDGRRLPYIDNLVNLIVVEDPEAIPMAEIMRVLAPGGAACLRFGGRWRVRRKPRPDNIDEWTHYQHGPDNNAVAEDAVVGPPRHMQWLAEPNWTRDHHADKGTNPSIRSVISSGGRIYYVADETRSSNLQAPSKWVLAARDAFSGVLLWKTRLRVAQFQPRLEELWRGAVADRNHVYIQLGAGQPLSALDAATGQLVRSYDGTADLREVILCQDALYIVTRRNELLALRASTGKLLWRRLPPDAAPIIPLTLAAADGKVFLRTDTAVYCFSADEGRVAWRFAPEGSGERVRLKWPREKLLVKNGVVLASYGGRDPQVLNRDRYQYLGSHPRVHEYGAKLAALSAEDGRVLWTTDYLPGLESTPGEIYVIGGLVWLGPDFAVARDLRTGVVQQTRPVIERLWTAGHHYRCYPGKATCRYILTAKRGVEFIDLEGEDHSRNNWVRGTCRVGVTPCNGLLYAPPHSCGCYMEAKLYGFWALAPERPAEEPAPVVPESRRLERGPAYGRISDIRSKGGERAAWPTLRGDSARSGSTRSPGPQTPQSLWTVKLGGRLSAPTVADGKVFVAQVDAHTLHALDADTGKPLWRFTAGGRIDSPPTLFQGLALFGAHDGWIYCLRASDGQPAWRMLAAPRRLNAVAHEQVESLWPVHGSLLVHNGIAYAAAGRSSYLDGGIVLYGLDPFTGRVACKRRIASKPVGATEPPSENERARLDNRFAQNHVDYKTFLAPDHSDAFSMTGAATDVLVADGASIFLRQLRFDGQLQQQDGQRPHLFSTSSLLDPSEHNRSYWVLGGGDFRRTPVAYPWIVQKLLRVPYGLTLAFDRERVWGVHREGKSQASGYALFAQRRPTDSNRGDLPPDFAAEAARGRRGAEIWSAPLGMRPRAMLRAGEALYVAGMTDQFDAEDPDSPLNAAYEGERDGILRMVSCEDGRPLKQQALPSPPVWDGMAAAEGRLFLTTRAGIVICLADR